MLNYLELWRITLYNWNCIALNADVPYYLIKFTLSLHCNCFICFIFCLVLEFIFSAKNSIAGIFLKYYVFDSPTLRWSCPPETEVMESSSRQVAVNCIILHELEQKRTQLHNYQFKHNDYMTNHSSLPNI